MWIQNKSINGNSASADCDLFVSDSDSSDSAVEDSTLPPIAKLSKDSLNEIFNLLPIEDLFQCKLVCKNWLTLTNQNKKYIMWIKFFSARRPYVSKLLLLQKEISTQNALRQKLDIQAIPGQGCCCTWNQFKNIGKIVLTLIISFIFVGLSNLLLQKAISEEDPYDKVTYAILTSLFILMGVGLLCYRGINILHAARTIGKTGDKIENLKTDLSKANRALKNLGTFEFWKKQQRSQYDQSSLSPQDNGKNTLIEEEKQKPYIIDFDNY